MKASVFHIRLVYSEYSTLIGFLTICDVTNHTRGPASKIRFSLRAEKIYNFCDEYENSSLESNSAHTSFHAAKLKHLTVGSRRKNKLLPGGGTLIFATTQSVGTSEGVTRGADCSDRMLLPISWRWDGKTPTALGSNYTGKGLSMLETLKSVYIYFSCSLLQEKGCRTWLK